MKKTIFTFVMAAILLCSMAVCASALEDYTATKDANDNYSYTVTYNVGAANKGEMYGMVAVTGVTNTDEPVINESNIVYIDQATADEAGNITFTKFAPMGKTPAETGYAESLVCIGGKGLDGATAIGTLKAVTTGGGDEGGDDPAPTTYKVSGTITDTVTGTKKDTKISFVSTAGTTEKTVAGAGAFEVEVAPGTYDIVFTKDGYLTKTFEDVVVADAVVIKDSATATDVALNALAGDVFVDGGIGSADLGCLLGDFFKTSGLTYAGSDIDADGAVGSADLGHLLGNFFKTNVVVNAQ